MPWQPIVLTKGRDARRCFLEVQWRAAFASNARSSAFGVESAVPGQDGMMKLVRRLRPGGFWGGRTDGAVVSACRGLIMRLASRSSRDQPGRGRRRGVSGWVGARAKGAEDKKLSREQLAQAPDQARRQKETEQTSGVPTSSGARATGNLHQYGQSQWLATGSRTRGRSARVYS